MLNSLKQPIIKDFYLNEFFLALYLYLFVLLRPLLSLSQTNSTMILFFCSFLIISVSIFYNYLFKKKRLTFYAIKGLLFIFFILSIVLIDIIIRSNSKSFNFIYDFIIYAIIPIYLFVHVKYYMRFIYYFGILSVFIFIMYAPDPFIDYKISKGYMTYGYSVMLPCFIGLHLLRNIFKKSKMFLLEIICFVLLLLFGNKGAIISVLIYIILWQLFIRKNNRRTISIYFISIFILIPILNNLRGYLEELLNYLTYQGYYSYSLKSFYNVLIGDSNGLSGRDVIWENAIELINQSLLFGNGLGTFESQFNTYSHNIILDIAVSYGVIGLAIFSSFLLIGLKHFIMVKKETRILFIIFFSLSIPKLMTSSYFFSEMGFWIFVFICINSLYTSRLNFKK